MTTNPSKELKQEFSRLLFDSLKRAFPKAEMTTEQAYATIEVPKGEHGDMSSSIAFRLAKQLKLAPDKIAEAVVAGIKPSGGVSEVKSLGGYISAWADQASYSKAVLDAINEGGGSYGACDSGKGEKVIVESPSVNPNKPWHIGQLRNALLGDVISNIHSACSYTVEREDYIDDLGLQVAESIWGYAHIAHNPDKKIDQWFGEQYVKVNKVMQEKNIQPELDELLKKMEDHRSKEAKLGRDLTGKVVRAQYETAFDYGIYHDVLIWESDIVRTKLLDKAITAAKEKGVLKTPKEGKFKDCLVVDLTGTGEFGQNEETIKVIVRSTGVATYVAKDFAFHAWKFGLINPGFKFSKFMAEQPNGRPLYSTNESGEEIKFGNVKKAINLIGAEQKYEQQVLRMLFARMGYPKIAENIVHLAYGLVSVESGSLSGRTGGWLGEKRNYTADDLLREVRGKAKELVLKSEKITDKSKVDDTAKAIAIAAIKFEYLKVTPEKEVVFSWEKALNFEGNSGPYCMYTYARAARILEKGSRSPIKLTASDYAQITRGKDFELLMMLGKAPEMVEKACAEYRPNIITKYLLDISSTFSGFYESMPVLKGGLAKDARLAVVAATKQVMGNMLALLGITPIEVM